MTAKVMLHVKDPKEVIHEALDEHLKSIEVFNNQILVAVYMRPESTSKGIILPEKYRDEDKWQGKVGLVVKMGPMAFISNDENDEWFKGVNVRVNDWIVFRPSDGWQLTVGSSPCRMLNDTSIKGKITNPDVVW